MQGSLSAAHEIGSHLLRLADRAGDDGWRVEARFAFGQTLVFHEADFVQARDLLMEGEALYDIGKHRRHALVYGPRPGCLLPRSRWLGELFSGMSGHCDEKGASCHPACGFRGTPIESCCGTFTTQLLQWLRTDAGIRELTAETIGIAEAYGLPFFRAWADVSLGCEPYRGHVRRAGQGS
jgi:hypothetical protein